METLEARLQSFTIAHSSTKKRTSNSKGAAKLKWPHEVPDPAQLAKAGFYYKPSSSAPDNTTCYLCHSSLDGWEENDSPIGEHLNFSPDCGWAIVARIEQDIEDGKLDQHDPMDEDLLNARKMTFGSNWPHENKRGWACKTEKCMFFAPSESSSEKAARGKKGRPSKAPRLSTRSNLTTASEDLSLVDLHMDEHTAASLQKHQPPENPRTTVGAKKAAKGRKTAPKSKRKASATQPDATIASSSFVEPEDDDFEIKIEQELGETTTGKKRKSDEMSVDDPVKPELKQDLQIHQMPPIKRRPTRSSVSQTNDVAESVLDPGQDDDSYMTDAEKLPLPPPPASKKPAKTGKRKASSSVRKASATSTASKASLRAAVPDDAEIDAALEADLNRPLTDDDVELDPPPIQKTKTRRLTKTRPGSRNITASTAPVRRVTRASALPVEDGDMPDIDTTTNNLEKGSIEGTNAVQIALTAMDHAKQEIIAETDKHKASTAKVDSGSPSRVKNTAKDGWQAGRDTHNVTATDTVHQENSMATVNPEALESHQQPEQLPEPNLPESAVSVETLKAEDVPESNTSTAAPAMTSEHVGTETQDNPSNQNRVKKAGKPRGVAVKKGKAVKKAVVANRDEEDAVPVEACRTEPVVLVESELPDNQGKDDEPRLPVMAPAPESLEGKAKGAKGGQRNTAKSKRSDTMPPTERSSVPHEAEVEAHSTTTHDHDAAGSTPIPADLQGRENNQNGSVRSVTPQVQAPSAHQTPTKAESPQSSDAENQPPSTRPSALRPPLVVQTPSKNQTTLVPLAAITPTVSPSKRNISRLQSALPWTSTDFEKIFNTPAADKENLQEEGVKDPKQALSSPEKMLTVEEWIQWNAKRGEEKLRDDCERLVGRFEGEGVRALKTLEGIACAE
ncbi:MAG: hypothetical protein LQ345_001492 [Seirophora villosa]|nr:MAG: hypothetical protein LQ345_001492 [Seirophora villosa]